ncbi:MAG: glycosyltransferase family 39 protein [Bacteroidales bacterium]|nr:glycosyltransferase family 39 protein [Bacteroidales bacterium]
MIKQIKHFKTKHPFLFIMMIGLVLRLIAVVFSRGFGMHDDHFLVIEAAGSWVDGYDSQGWLPGTNGNTGPEGHSFFYVGFHYLFLGFLKLLGISNPQWIMLFVRLIHALLSLLVISFGYRIASLLTEKQTAYKVALLLAVFWFMPFLSVRNLVEVVSVPFLMYGSLIILRQELIRKKNEPGYHRTSFLVAGFFLGLAFSVRYQTIFYAGGIGLALLLMKNWKGMLTTAGGFLISVIIFQGFIDFYIWKKPFAELIAYVTYNLNHAYDYHNAPWYHFVLVLFGLLIPPVSVMLIFGFLKDWKRHFLLFLPVFVFLFFHSIFPNKQERFILPIVPMFIVLGMIGWDDFISKSKFWKNNIRMEKGFWTFFWLINIVLLMLITPMYSKKARVESMSYLRNYPQTKKFFLEDINSNILRFPPVFYTGHNWPKYNYMLDDNTYAEMAVANNWKEAEHQPDFVFFVQDKQLETRIDSVKKYLPHLVHEKSFKPGNLDRLIHWLNPINANETIHLYRNEARIPKSLKP